MLIKKCTMDDARKLAVLNKQLIDDEKSSNPMNIAQLEERMQGFLQTEYDAYFFVVDEETVGYALVKNNCTPLYLRQFMIDRKYRRQHYGTEAFRALLKYLNVTNIGVEVLPWNVAGVRFWESCGFREMCRYMRYEEKTE